MSQRFRQTTVRWNGRLAGSERRLGRGDEDDDGDGEHDPAHPDQAVAGDPDPEVAADADEEQDSGQEDRDADVLVGVLARLRALLEVGVGLGASGWKAAARTRVNLLKSSWTPTFGVGLSTSTGSLDQDFDDTTGGNTIAYVIRSAPTLQIVGGVEGITDSGFTFLGTLGYAHVLREEPVVVVSGAPNKEQRNMMDVLYDSGIVLAVAMGYTF